MREEFTPAVMTDGSTVQFLGRAGRRKQHRVYDVKYAGRHFTVTPGEGLATTIVEIPRQAFIERQVIKINGPTLGRLIELTKEHERALKAKYAPE